MTESNKKSIELKKQAIEAIGNSIQKHIDKNQHKKANNLSYWIKNYSKYHDDEKTFGEKGFIVYKRGQIILVNLGFRVGNELGGLHFCVVISKNDNIKNGVLNVIPLSSKNKKKRDAISLGKEVYDLLKNSIDEAENNLSDHIKLFDKALKMNEYEELDLKRKISEVLTFEKEKIESIRQEIEKYNKDSIVILNQITTISKQRIFNKGYLNKIRISDESLNKIDASIIENYTK